MDKSLENDNNCQKSEILLSFSRQQLKNMDFDPMNPEMYQNQKPQITFQNQIVPNQQIKMAIKPQINQGQWHSNNQMKQDNPPKSFNPSQYQLNQGLNKNVLQNNFVGQLPQYSDSNQPFIPQQKQLNFQNNQFQTIEFNTQNYIKQFNQFNQNNQYIKNSNPPYSYQQQ
ncbi:unnamed protein product [Paramecium pentaurelia]|uniref:Uncharacterized protein n=1 Tax=Paramecium pentaurelia TaxID=43138 RepID=A0A8S1YDM3_9CILI|nr:unnamed protein product [Paramecium pentaurelia]